jgi:energy-coupling factor transporter ATP-binding protein EcfA2
MLLAVARTGSACGLLLLDEVDAALDEVNQARASALLRQLAHDKVSACQILCVTHNFSFQESCDGFVLVAKSESGHSVPAEQAAGGGTAAAATAAAGNGGSSKKGGRQGRGLVMGAKGRGGQIGGVGRAKRVRFAEGG